MALALRSLQARIQARAQLSPAPDAVSLVVGRQACGSLAPDVAARLAQGVPGLSLESGLLELRDAGLDPAARSAHLLAAAQLLLREGYAGPWRNENLEIRPHPDAPALAWIDRSAVRVLGITSYSVHLNGFAADGRMVVARRAAHKRIDPGLWDNLAGGMICAGESVSDALAREAFEEAGINLSVLAVTRGARISVRRPIAEGTLAEAVHVFDVELPEGTPVVNQDGEVERFETRTITSVLAAIDRGEFTVESALAILDSLIRRGYEAESG